MYFARVDVTFWDQPGEVKPPSPLRERIKSIGSQYDSAQTSINRLDQVCTFDVELQHQGNTRIQELEKGVPDDERPAKLNKLCKLCSKHKLIPDSMKLQDQRNNSGELTEYKGPYSVYQSEFKGRKVAIKVMRIYVPQKHDDALSVSVAPRIPPL